MAEFGDQADAVAEARVRLTAGGSASRPSPSLPVSRMVTGHSSNADIVTPDGRFMAGTDWHTGDLLVRDLTSREERRPVRGRLSDGGLQDWAESPAFSPDMSQIAYSWFATDGEGRTTNSLRVVSRAGSAPREIVNRFPEYRNFDVAAWSPDGRSLLVTVMKPLPDLSVQIAWVSLETGEVRVLRTFESWQKQGNSLGKVSLSTDGHWILYSALASKESLDRHVYALAADGSGQSQLTMTAGACTDPV